MVFVLLGGVELFTDVAGIHVLRPNNAADGDRDTLRRVLSTMGCELNDSSAWMKAGDFERCIKLTAVETTSPFR